MEAVTIGGAQYIASRHNSESVQASLVRNQPKCCDRRNANAARVRTGLAAVLTGITDISHTYNPVEFLTLRLSSTTESCRLKSEALKFDFQGIRNVPQA